MQFGIGDRIVYQQGRLAMMNLIRYPAAKAIASKYKWTNLGIGRVQGVSVGYFFSGSDYFTAKYSVLCTGTAELIDIYEDEILGKSGIQVASIHEQIGAGSLNWKKVVNRDVVLLLDESNWKYVMKSQSVLTSKVSSFARATRLILVGDPLKNMLPLAMNLQAIRKNKKSVSEDLGTTREYKFLVTIPPESWTDDGREHTIASSRYTESRHQLRPNAVRGLFFLEDYQKAMDLLAQERKARPDQLPPWQLANHTQGHEGNHLV